LTIRDATTADSDIICQLFDKDLVTDDFLGQVPFNALALVGKGPTTLPLQGRGEKKEKIKGTVTVEVQICGSAGADSLGSSLTDYYAKAILGQASFKETSAIFDLWLKYRVLAAQNKKKGLTMKQLPEFLQKINAKVSAEEAAQTLKIYDDNNDGLIEFTEVMGFIVDTVKKAKSGEAGKFLFLGMFSALIDGEGRLDQKTTRTIFEALVPDKEKRDEEKLNEVLDKVVKDVMEGLDDNNDGTINKQELRKFCLEGSTIQAIILELREIPMKK